MTTLRLAVEAVAADHTALAASILDSVPPEAPRGSATVANCIGVALEVLDQQLSRSGAMGSAVHARDAAFGALDRATIDSRHPRRGAQGPSISIQRDTSRQARRVTTCSSVRRLLSRRPSLQRALRMERRSSS
jgi:hypothetical protein